MRWIVAALLATVAAAGHAQNVTDKIDRFTGEREIAYTSSARPTGLAHPIFTLKGGVGRPDSGFVVQLVFASIHDRRRGSAWRFLRCHTMDWLVDGQPVALGPVVHRGDVMRGGVMEFITQQIDEADIARIGRAQQVEFRVCGEEFALHPEEIRAFQIVAEKIGAVPQVNSDS